uniref:Heparan sulphate-N-deacetylase domain-containing protein n=1 Tax=Plectus sambesii TaxID=2011161 RepID=A0A914XDU9_9BILA
MNSRQLKMILCNWRHLNTSRRPRMQQLKLMLVVMLAIALFTLAYQAANVLRPEAPIHRDPPQQLPNYVCHSCGSACEPNLLSDVHSSERPDYQQQEELKATDDRVLVLVETLYSPLGKEICDILNALKLPYKAEPLGKNLPLLTTATRGRFALIIIENYYKYLNLVEWNRQLLDKYCVDYSVALIGFLTTRPKPTFVKSKVKGAALTLYQKQRVRNLTFSVGSSVPFIARRGQVLPLPEPDEADWVVFQGQHNSTYESVLVADVVYDDEEPLKPYNMAAVMLDRGEEDGIRRVLLGQKLNHWLVKLSFIDGIRHLTNGRLGMPLERYLQVDIDDIFVGQVGRRMIADDVLALIESQKRMREMVPGFTYNLGFSGKYFLNGDDLEDQGDTLLVEQASQFVWFPHMWRHNHAHRHNLTYLEAIMTQNRLFA